MQRRSSNLASKETNSKISTSNVNENMTNSDNSNPFGETFSMTPRPLLQSTPVYQSQSSVNTAHLLFAPSRGNHDFPSTTLQTRVRQLEDELEAKNSEIVILQGRS